LGVHRAAPLLVLWAAACDGVFKLSPVPSPIDGPGAGCDYLAPLPPNGDKDLDSEINSVDACPTVPDEGTHDEDGDLTLDACDPCPMLMVDGSDEDCDLVGAACDPDEAVPHEQTFFGFGDTKGLVTSSVTFVSDQLQGPSGAMSGSVMTTDVATPIARYEIGGTVHAIDSQFRSVTVDLLDVTTAGFFSLRLGLDDGYAALDIRQNNNVVIARALPMPTAFEVAFKLVVDYDGTLLKLTISGDFTSSVSMPAVLDTVRYGVTVFHDTGQNTLAVDYLRRIAPR
jgi:hypothetical protein